MVGTGQGARAGILVRNAEALERAERIAVLALDKTGTLTRGEPEVTDVLPFAGDTQAALRLAAALEQGSEHPLGRAILKRAGAVDLPKVANFSATPGQGVTGEIDGRRLRLGSPDWLGFASDLEVRRLQQQQKTVVVLEDDGLPLALLAIADALRPTSRAAVARLRARGIRVVMLTGDNLLTATAIAREAGIDEIRAGIMPGAKADAVNELKAGGGLVAMVGDGINDAPALAAADVSFGRRRRGRRPDPDPRRHRRCRRCDRPVARDDPEDPPESLFRLYL
jgi:Cu+-exporting ATPase